MYDTFRLEEGCRKLKITLSEHQIQQFLTYYELLVDWNTRMNLTAITEFQDVVTKHFLDSLSLVQAVDLTQVRTMMDVGTGAGFPGIPIKIAFPELEVTLLDSLNKRVLFLKEVIRQLQLEQIEAVHGRAEDFGKQAQTREHYDLCVSRAVANLSSLSEYCIPFVRVGGTFLSYKSGAVKEEVQQASHAIEVLGGKPAELTCFTLADTEMERSLVKIEKVRSTPKKYPRKAGLPGKEPL